VSVGGVAVPDRGTRCSVLAGGISWLAAVCGILIWRLTRPVFTRPTGNAKCPPLRVRCEHSVEAQQRVTRWRYQPRQASHEFEWIHHPMCCAPFLNVTQSIGDHTVIGQGHSFEAQYGSCAVPHQAFAAFPVVLGNGDSGMNIEAAKISRVRGMSLGKTLFVMEQFHRASGFCLCLGQLAQLTQTQRTPQTRRERISVAFIAGVVIVGAPQQPLAPQPTGESPMHQERDIFELNRFRWRQGMKRRMCGAA